MKLFTKVILLAVMVIVSIGCSKNNLRQIVGSAVADGANTQVKYTPQECKVLEQRCVQGDFQEWETSDKEMGCSCKKL